MKWHVPAVAIDESPGDNSGEILPFGGAGRDGRADEYGVLDDAVTAALLDGHFAEAVVDNPGAQTEADEGDGPLALFSGEQHLGELAARLSGSPAAHSPRIVNHRCQRDQRCRPHDCA